jgi:enoyl-CoA hydratase
MTLDFGGADEILFEKKGVAGVVTLNRPKSLNAASRRMLLALEKALKTWEHDASVHRVTIRAEGRAFSAGGDLVEVYEPGLAGNPHIPFFADEYRINAYLGRFPKPIVSLINGIVMGGGVGISVHGSHRVFSENAVFAMPEVGIGFFPDVGGSHFLPRLVDHFGLYLGMTAARIRYGDALFSGIATHAVAAEDFPVLADALQGRGDTDEIIAPFAIVPDPMTTDKMRRDISYWFSADTLEELVKRVENAAGQGNELAASIVASFARNSPTSIAVAFREIREGARLSLDDCMRMEFRIVCRMLRGREFYEGIRAVVVDKDNKPNWEKKSVSDVNFSDIDAYFAPLPDGELQLN